MNKVLVKLYVPTIGKEYDIWLPLNRKIHNIVELIVKTIYEFTDGEYLPSYLPQLYDRKTGKIFDVNLTVRECNIRNSSELLLV